MLQLADCIATVHEMAHCVPCCIRRQITFFPQYIARLMRPNLNAGSDTKIDSALQLRPRAHNGAGGKPSNNGFEVAVKHQQNGVGLAPQWHLNSVSLETRRCRTAQAGRLAARAAAVVIHYRDASNLHSKGDTNLFSYLITGAGSGGREGGQQGQRGGAHRPGDGQPAVPGACTNRTAS